MRYTTLAVGILLIALNVSSCIKRKTPSTLTSSSQPDDVNYASMSAQEVLDKKYQMMSQVTHGKIEQQILDAVYKGFSWGRVHGKWPLVNMEDLMAHARQESSQVLDMLEAGKTDLRSAGTVGSTLWGYYSNPGQDLTGAISFSVWQGVEVEYLLSGRKYSDELNQIYKDYMVKYAFDGNDNLDEETRENKAWGYKKKIKDAAGEKEADKIFQSLIDRIVKTCSADPSIHVKIMADLLTKHFENEGAHSPLAIRSYFLNSIQRNLNPDNWLAPVRFKDDILPSKANNYTDNNFHKRGDYGKQVVMGNTYNDRGMIYWYGVTRDHQTINQIVDIWSSDPARLKKADYQLLSDKGYLRYKTKDAATFDYLMRVLPEK